jgi:hypothetical protein
MRTEVLIALLCAPLVWFVLFARGPAPLRDRKPRGVNPLAAWRETKRYGDEREGYKG